MLVGLTACAHTVRVGSTGDYPPFSERTADGAWQGFDIEVARAWAHDRGRRLEVVPVRWADLEGALERREFEVAMSGVTVRADRLLVGRFTAAVARAEAVLVTRRGAPAPHRVAVNRGGHLERLARARLPGVELEAIDDNRRLLALLESGAVDAVVTDTIELHAVAPDLAAKDLVVAAALSEDRKAYFLLPDAVAPARDLDAWLEARERDGWLPALRARLLGDASPSPPPASLARVTDLIARRLMLMPAVAAAKRSAGLPIVDATREADVERRAVERAAGAGLAPEPYRALVRAQIAAARAVQEAAVDATSGARLALVRAGIDRVDESLLPALLDALPIAAPAGILVEAIRRDAGVAGLADDTLRPVADALRGLRAEGQGRTADLPGLDASAKLPAAEDSSMAKAIWNGAVLADSDRTELVEGNHYFPPEALRREHLRDSATHSTCGWKGEASYYDVVVGDQSNRDAAWYYPEPKDAARNIKGWVAFWRGVRVEP